MIFPKTLGQATCFYVGIYTFLFVVDVRDIVIAKLREPKPLVLDDSVAEVTDDFDKPPELPGPSSLEHD